MPNLVKVNYEQTRKIKSSNKFGMKKMMITKREKINDL